VGSSVFYQASSEYESLNFNPRSELDEHSFNFVSLSHLAQAGPTIQLRARLLNMVIEYDAIASSKPVLSLNQRIKLTALLKLYCGFVGLLKFKPEEEEVNGILALLMKVKDER